MHLKVVLLASMFILSSMAPFRKYDDVFKLNENGEKVIIDPTKPIKSGRLEFYWENNFQPSINYPVHCKLSLPSSSWTLGTVRFANGSEPSFIMFSCPQGYFCHKIACYSEDIRPVVALFIALVAVVMAIVWIVCAPARILKVGVYVFSSDAGYLDTVQPRLSGPHLKLDPLGKVNNLIKL